MLEQVISKVRTCICPFPNVLIGYPLIARYIDRIRMQDLHIVCFISDHIQLNAELLFPPKSDDKVAKEKLWGLVLQKESSIFSTSLMFGP